MIVSFGLWMDLFNIYFDWFCILQAGQCCRHYVRGHVIEVMCYVFSQNTYTIIHQLVGGEKNCKRERRMPNLSTFRAPGKKIAYKLLSNDIDRGSFGHRPLRNVQKRHQFFQIFKKKKLILSMFIKQKTFAVSFMCVLIYRSCRTVCTHKINS